MDRRAGSVGCLSLIAAFGFCMSAPFLIDDDNRCALNSVFHFDPKPCTMRHYMGVKDPEPGTRPTPDLPKVSPVNQPSKLETRSATPWPTLGPTCRLPDGQQVSGNYSDSKGFCENGKWILRGSTPTYIPKPTEIRRPDPTPKRK